MSIIRWIRLIVGELLLLFASILVFRSAWTLLDEYLGKSNLWLALAFNWLHVWSATTAGTALSCLALDQVPTARGTMMSMKSVFGNIGNTLGPALGGVLLIWASYPTLGLVLGAMSIIASAIILFIANNTT